MLAEAVASVLGQTFVDYELIVVDDGSTDGSAARLASFAGKLRIIRTAHRGVSAARNAGVSHSGGDYIAFLDSDDLWRPAKLARQFAYMKENPEIEICQTEEIWIRNAVRVNPKAIHRKPAGDVFFRSLELCLVSPSAVMLRRALFERLGGFDESLPVSEDYDLWLRIAVAQPIGLLSEPLVIKRGGHPDQLSRSIWGMDRYRVVALQKLLRGGLNGPRREAVVQVLRQKLAILANGARKRGKIDQAEKFEGVLADFDLEAASNTHSVGLHNEG
jgi:GT2 family glycosyltransferase